MSSITFWICRSLWTLIPVLSVYINNRDRHRVLLLDLHWLPWIQTSVYYLYRHLNSPQNSWQMTAKHFVVKRLVFAWGLFFFCTTTGPRRWIIFFVFKCSCPHRRCHTTEETMKRFFLTLLGYLWRFVNALSSYGRLSDFFPLGSARYFSKTLYFKKTLPFFLKGGAWLQGTPVFGFKFTWKNCFGLKRLDVVQIVYNKDNANSL